MHLTKHEVEQLKTAGFNDQHIEEIQVAKTGAGQDWTDLLSKLIANGPQILAFLKLFSGLFSNAQTPTVIPPK